ncbi:hypothetical protein LO763_00725 [Glycomyces sp. A-F 0318]|uniref:hypothetical protein n=1 Tax=Glycomyces amatae TaxID=2881355 RepID=UPI001E45FEEB|nr:hypothetical protein [Glycomyces amatae]MCD0442149.1 hypothetical protein [Glycomyces amatae]
MRYQPLSTVRRIGGDRVLALGPGDALVATEKQLFIWWGHHGRWQALDANAWGARRDDWGRLRAWTKAVWPRHHLPDRAVIERPHGR